MKLHTLHEAKYAGNRIALQKFLSFFYSEPELSDDEDGTLYFPNEEYIVRNRAIGTLDDEVMWIKIVKHDPSKIGVMYVDDEHDWIPTQEVLEGFSIFKIKQVYGK